MKLGIRKTKANIFWLFVMGLLIGLIMGLRQPIADKIPESGQATAPVVNTVQK